MSVRAWISLILTVIDVVVLGMTIASVDGPVRFILGLVLVLYIPGWSIVGLLHLHNAPLEVALSVAGSLALLMACAQLLMTVHYWHLGVLEIVVCILCLPSLLIQVRGREVVRYSSP